ncbi:MAG: protein kinase [Reyranellaceae bacterium]
MPGLAETDARGEFRGGLPAGTNLGGYELKSILGKGAFGITYRARDFKRDCEVAIKEYLPATLALREGRTTIIPHSSELAEQFAWGRERFLEEANTLKRLDHAPSIVSVLDFLEANGTAYMVMVLIEGETLAHRLLREQRLTSEAVERLLFPLLDGLEQVHAIGFLHRDIKPANIMIGPKGEPTLIDFGASRAAIAERSTTITAVFTPGYAAVEQFTSTKLGPWSDIYGLAATLYHAISGHIPPSALHRMLKDEYEPLIDIQPAGYSRTMLAAIDTAMAVPSDDRPRSIAEWRGMLSSPPDATRVMRQPGRLARVARKTRRARLNVGAPALVLSAVAAVALLGGAGYLALTASGPPTVTAAALNLSAEQLEQALAERRKADTLAADKRRAEEEARQRAEREAEAKRQAEAALEQARQARQRADQELAAVNSRVEAGKVQEAGRDQITLAAQREAEAVAQRKAEADAAAMRQAEEQAKKQLEADAEAKRQADEALAKAEAERQRADQEARQKAEAEAAALRQASEETQRKAAEAESKRQAEEAQAKARAEREKADADAKAKAEADKSATALAKLKEEAEAAEKGMRLEPIDRERLQVALTSLGFDTQGFDGVFGPRSREMIAAWQKARNQPTTGFVNAAQQQAMLKEAVVAVSKFDERKKGEEEAKGRVAAIPRATAAAAGPQSSVPPAPTDPRSTTSRQSSSEVSEPTRASPDGLWRGTYACTAASSTASPHSFSIDLALKLTNGVSAGGGVLPNSSNDRTVEIQVSVEPSNVTVTRRSLTNTTNPALARSSIVGRFDGNSIRASGRSGGSNPGADVAYDCILTLARA